MTSCLRRWQVRPNHLLPTSLKKQKHYQWCLQDWFHSIPFCASLLPPGKCAACIVQCQESYTWATCSGATGPSYGQPTWGGNIVHCSLKIVHYIVQSKLHCTEYTTLYTVHYIVHNALCTLHCSGPLLQLYIITTQETYPLTLTPALRALSITDWNLVKTVFMDDIFDVMDDIFMSWCHGWYFDVMDDILMSLMVFWCHGWYFDVMMPWTIFWCHDNALMSWMILWCHGWYINVMGDISMSWVIY